MEPTAAFIGAIAGSVIAIALFLLMRRGRSDDMIERQKRETSGLFDKAPRPDHSGHNSGRISNQRAPDNLRSDEAALLAVPEIRSAMERRRKIEAIKLVRERAGIGLKDAKELVERAMRHR